ncbi:unnamed protein product, partial [Prorocentrum cordatum]
RARARPAAVPAQCSPARAGGRPARQRWAAAGGPENRPAGGAKPHTAPGAARAHPCRLPRAMMGPSAEAAEVGTVCVTGAAGYLAAHVVRGLLDRGHRVRGSVRSLGDQAKTAPLRALPGAAERLELAEADLMEPAGFPALLRGCRTLIHTATPIRGRGDAGGK